MPPVKRLIRRYSRRFGVDPGAAIAVAKGEGGLRWGAVGDQGSSFGPFQLHRGGALPAGKGAAWANSPAGIRYAIRAMSKAGARGLTGADAIRAIITQFERPADPQSSIAAALSRYRQTPGLGGGSVGQALGGGAQGGDTNALAMALLARIGEDDPEEQPSIMDLVQASQAGQAAPNQSGGGVPNAAGGPGGGAAAMRAAIQKARQMGLNVGENPAAGGGLPTSGHVENSWHYRTFGRHPNVGRGLDVSGDPQAMRRFALWLARNRAREKELYYSPLGGRFVMSGHDDHVHVAY